MRAALIALSLALVALAACNLVQETKYWVARTASPDGKFWQIYYDGAWHDVTTDGVRPPSYVVPSVLEADNRYLFAGQLDTAGVARTEMPIIRLAAWNILPPVRRQVAAGEQPDTTGVHWLTQDDFSSLNDFQRFSLLAASLAWPWTGRGVELPDSSGARRPR